MRLFIAINFPDKIKRGILLQIVKLKLLIPQVSWVKAENLHLTLKFLGYSKGDKLEKIKKGIGAVIKDFEPFELNISKGGYFQREPFIIQLNLGNSATLNSLANRLEKEMGKLGFKKEIHPYTPHVTLGRGRRLKKEEVEDIKRAINQIRSLAPIKFEVKNITLVESQMTRSGSIYTDLDVYEFPV
ncbi:2'-5' RNA ligase [Candidatus Gottesmanbacteria bacterium RIFCSPLOWO2_01_FULL_39_12b]|uniref:RNA 2',3'-cyclic phosphodiesterase n=1 Tax=Candidatus Gottesmanbacteria bacterium RIFCSPLOWO2_01_FULL_39_12b TaxID=1798388 RepID=A0A1F6ASC7_9BACT|nr:MAG: 2'-5' RNA ligase [Candidatus Gottesmanbacteria bacterium RIFCSPLOWO2_01_FULL_39_12b]